MGKQVGFYAIVGDYDELVSKIEALGLLALPASIPSDLVPEPISPRAFKLESRSWRCFYLVPPEIEPASIIYTPMKVPPTRRLADERSPVIEFQPSKIEGDSIDAGRIYLRAPRRTRGYDVASKRYESVARWLKRWTKMTDSYSYPYYVGPATAPVLCAGALCPRSGAVRVRLVEPKG